MHKINTLIGKQNLLATRIEVEFNNTPFAVQDIQRLECQLGTHYYNEKQSAHSSQVSLQDTRKIGCKVTLLFAL